MFCKVSISNNVVEVGEKFTFESFYFCKSYHSQYCIFPVLQTSRLISNVIVVPGGAEQRKAELGAP